MSEILNKIKSFLIRLLAGKNMMVVLNTNINSKKGIIIDKDYIVIGNVNIVGFDSAITIRCKTTIDNKNLSIDNKSL